MIRSITPDKLSLVLETWPGVTLIDVREQWEHDNFNIGGKCIPLGEILKRCNELETGSEIIVYCEKGIRSQIAIQRLAAKMNTDHLLNLAGGIQYFRQKS